MNGNSLKKNEVEFTFEAAISKNVYDGAWKNFFSKMKKKSEFERSKKDIPVYVSDLIRNGTLTHEKLNDFLFKELSYGMHKDALLYSFEELNVTDDEVLDIINEKFRKNSLSYNELSISTFNLFNVEDIKDAEDLAAIDVQVNEESNKVEKVNLIFAKKVKYKKREEKINFGKLTKVDVPYYENSYFPIEIDFISNILIVKSAPKSRMNIGEYKGINVSKHFADMIIDSFGLKLISRQFEYQKTLYNMCDVLLEGVIKEKCKNEMDNFSTIIEDVIEIFEEKFVELEINIKELEATVTNKNVFNISNQMSNMIGNILISKRLNEVMKNKEGIDGIISYIKFKDKSAVKTILKTESRQQTLLDSQAFLDLRKTIKECKLAERIRVLWYNNREEIQLSYDSRNLMYIHIHFYERLFEKELRYAIRKIEQFK